ncbi:MAG: TIGR00282 family metallophosphoesterase [Elusimicrobiota bacterium]
MKIIFIADIIGKPGRAVLSKELPLLIHEECPDLVIANGENAAAGFGITPDVAKELFENKIDVITLGNHTWDKKEVASLLDDPGIVRPANYPEGVKGKGYTIVETKKGQKVGVLNLMGRVFMNSIDCPFKKADAVIEEIKKETQYIIVDVHAEATSEKNALGWYLDGRVSAVLGTHTHVQTSDDKILPRGTAYITDVGMTGSQDSVIGIKKEIIIEKFLKQVPIKYEVNDKKLVLEGVIVNIDDKSGKAVSIKRLRKGDMYGNSR